MPDVSRARQQHRDGAAAHAVLSSKSLLLDSATCPPRPYLAHLSICETCMTRALAERLAPFTNFVGDVVCIGPQKQVIRTNTRRVIAAVEDVHPVSDRPEVQLPRETVGHIGLSALPARQLAVTSGRARAFPDPAVFRLVYERPETGGDWTGFPLAVARLATELPAAFADESSAAVTTGTQQFKANYTTTTRSGGLT